MTTAPQLQEVQDSSALATLAGLHLAVEREHDREAVLQSHAAGRVLTMPDWRFHRHVIRIGLYLHERLGLEPGDRVAILSPLRPEWIVADWAVVTRGMVTVVVHGSLPDAAWESLQPKAAFVAGPAVAERLLAVPSLGTCLRKIVLFDGSTPSERTPSFTEVLDLGGTLDTAERANAFRAEARRVSPEAQALVHARAKDDGSLEVTSLTHRDVVERLQRRWSVSRPRKGRVEYVGAAVRSVAEHVALYGKVADGLTSTAIGTEVES